MKATYRPMSMPLDMLMAEDGDMGSQDGSKEDLNNSGIIYISYTYYTLTNLLIVQLSHNR